METKILIIDNYDSFTYNLVHLVSEVTGVKPDVIRNDSDQLDDLTSYSHLILSPGPGLPSEAGKLLEVIKTQYTLRPILGVCLGHQAIAEVFGGDLINLEQVFHGVSDTMKITKLNEQLFSGMTDIFKAARYHSWVVNEKSLPTELEINCVDSNGYIMGLTHKDFPVKGVQFHPESYLSEYGKHIISNFLSIRK